MKRTFTMTNAVKEELEKTNYNINFYVNCEKDYQSYIIANMHKSNAVSLPEKIFGEKNITKDDIAISIRVVAVWSDEKGVHNRLMYIFKREEVNI